ncbi:hypothetical protein Acsp03_38410 [Actinomadura sp. NBRC 104412]|nr:hypothetical protein Acsp03_38410 [Actinomadura sp. NBRC 104412]
MAPVQGRIARIAESSVPSGSTARFPISYTRGEFQMFGLGTAPGAISAMETTVVTPDVKKSGSPPAGCPKGHAGA